MILKSLSPHKYRKLTTFKKEWEYESTFKKEWKICGSETPQGKATEVSERIEKPEIETRDCQSSGLKIGRGIRGTESPRIRGLALVSGTSDTSVHISEDSAFIQGWKKKNFLPENNRTHRAKSSRVVVQRKYTDLTREPAFIEKDLGGSAFGIRYC